MFTCENDEKWFIILVRVKCLMMTTKKCTFFYIYTYEIPLIFFDHMKCNELANRKIKYDTVPIRFVILFRLRLFSWMFLSQSTNWRGTPFLLLLYFPDRHAYKRKSKLRSCKSWRLSYHFRYFPNWTQHLVKLVSFGWVNSRDCERFSANILISTVHLAYRVMTIVNFGIWLINFVLSTHSGCLIWVLAAALKRLSCLFGIQLDFVLELSYVSRDKRKLPWRRNWQLNAAREFGSCLKQFDFVCFDKLAWKLVCL